MEAKAMRAIRIPNGNLLIPVATEESDANDYMVEITADDPEYATWLSIAVDGDDPRWQSGPRRKGK
jgi:hypothetical protein